ncbi:MAG TPA: hypothetical protein VG317_05920 [Pseudonocardiaceae bacterium]|jgi:hypothetical protein|nr:hypothetical protein [Pseudonocardiaceae bacterium]
MFTDRGISVDASVLVEGHCSVSCEVLGDQAEFTFGSDRGALSLLANEAALAKIARISTEAITRLQAIPEGQEVCFQLSA